MEGLLPSLLRALFLEMVLLGQPVKLVLSKNLPTITSVDDLGLSGINTKIQTPSHTAKNLFPGLEDSNSERTGLLSPNDVDFSAHMESSRNRFIELQTKVQRAIADRRFLHIEDGESDDIWHNEIEARTGVTPPKVFLVGGYHKVRRACAIQYWQDICKRNDVEIPHIMTMAGTMEGHSAFDKAEGAELLESSEISRLQAESLNPTDKEYLQSTQEAKEELEKMLKENDFTVLLLKSAPPAGLANILKKYEHKFAIIWAGPVREIRESGLYEVRYNYYRAPKEADELLKLKAPTIIMSNLLDNTDMNSIVDQRLLGWYKSFVKTSSSFEGFENLMDVPKDKETNLFWFYITHLARKMKEKLIEDYRQEKARLKEKEKTVESNAAAEMMRLEARLKEVRGTHQVPLKLEENQKQEPSPNPKEQEEILLKQQAVRHQLKAALLEIQQERDSKLPLGRRMLKLSKINPNFLEYCPLDQTLLVLTDPLLNKDLEEVIEVSMKRPVQDQNSRGITIKPQFGGNNFIISSFKSTGLQDSIQKTINFPGGRHAVKQEIPNLELRPPQNLQYGKDLSSSQ